MKSVNARLAILALCLCAGSVAAAHAAPPVDTRFTYQGRLSEDGVLGNAKYDLLFSVYDVAAAGAPLAVFPVNDITVVNGLFQTEVSFPAGVYSPGQKRWMQVEVRPGASVGAYSVLGARQELLAVPFATRTLNVDTLQDAYTAGRNVATASGAILLQTPLDYNFAAGAADAIHVTQGQIRLGSQPGGGRGQFMLNNSSNAGALTGYVGTLFGGTIGDCVAGWTQLGNPSSGLLTSNQEFLLSGSLLGGTGGSLRLGGAVADPSAVVIDGRGGAPYMVLSGNVNAVAFDPDNATADNKVQLPLGSIMSAEIGDEAGVASAVEGSGSVTLTTDGVLKELLTRTINAPAPGYVLVIGTCQPIINHNSGTSDFFEFGVSTVGASLPANQDVALAIPTTAGTGAYDYPITVHGLFAVPGGPITMHFLARQSSGGSTSVFDMQLSCIYLPTSYGTVSSTLFAAPPDNHARNIGGATSDDIAAERQQSIAIDLARVQRENADMRLRLERIEAEIKNHPTPSMTPPSAGNGSGGGR